ncbi:MAG TPA: hypothetical protein VK666_20590 [Chryseolinea sp.]|nr:hypothetical protein [Chryseolinea sp.]
MKKLLLPLLLLYASLLHAQNSPDSVKQEAKIQNADDPSQFFTRIEVYSELQYYDKTDVYLNQAIFRSIWKLGKRFTTRIDVPLVYNSFSGTEYKQSGLGDISFRLLGYKFREKAKSAFTASIEISLNTAESPLLGTGKNLLIPVVSYTQMIPKQKMLFSLVLQQANSISGDENRADISFTKVQAILLKTWTKRLWTVVAPEWFVDYVHGGLSMNFRTRMAYAPTPRINIWISPSIGVFGDFAGRYQWGGDVGGRYFLFKGMSFSKKK